MTKINQEFKITFSLTRKKKWQLEMKICFLKNEEMEIESISKNSQNGKWMGVEIETRIKDPINLKLKFTHGMLKIKNIKK